MQTLKGLVVQNTGSFYLVKAEEKLYSCKLKGSFKMAGIRTTNPIAIGDWVLFESSKSSHEGEDFFWIVEILPRKNYIIRRASNLSKQAHILGANLDRTLLLVTINFPVTSTTFIDRYLATAEAYQVPVAIAFNKVDRYGHRELAVLRDLESIYSSVGYECFSLSALTGDGMEAIKCHLSEGVTLLAGHSGVGKSTFINALVPEANQDTSDISEAHNVGVHTTTFSTMIPFGESGYLIDTPGVKGFGTIDFEREEVGHYFPEIFNASGECFYGNCTHTHEPRCAVRELLNAGKITDSRYKSYLSILYDDEEEKYRL